MGLQIDYPCEWRYRLIGESAEAIQAAVAAVLEETPHELSKGNQSTEGRYVSMTLALEVQDEAQRLEIHERLGASPAIRMIL